MNALSIKPPTSFSGRVFKSLLVLFSLSALVACSSKVTVVSNIPAPLVQRVPLNVHLSYTDEFKNHVYIENEKKRALTSLDFAQAQTDMFNVIFAGLTTLVTADDVSKDLTIEPEVLTFEYSTPSETSLKQYEVSLKYRLKLLRGDGAKLADWIVKGYGKTPTAMLTSATQAFNSATNIALRDIGAQLATRFTGQEKIKAMIDKKSSLSLKQAAAAKANVGLAENVESELNNAAQKVTEESSDE